MTEAEQTLIDYHQILDLYIRDLEDIVDIVNLDNDHMQYLLNQKDAEIKKLMSIVNHLENVLANTYKPIVTPQDKGPWTDPFETLPSWPLHKPYFTD
jgi:hypothetical protein